jgi:hypothetical protein
MYITTILPDLTPDILYRIPNDPCHTSSSEFQIDFEEYIIILRIDVW